MKHDEKYTPINFQRVIEIHTNNFVESWYNTLKSLYLKGARKQHIDILVCRLIDEIPLKMRRKRALTLDSFRRRTKLAEPRQLDKSIAISNKTTSLLVLRSFDCDETESILRRYPFVLSRIKMWNIWYLWMIMVWWPDICTLEFRKTPFFVNTCTRPYEH